MYLHTKRSDTRRGATTYCKIHSNGTEILHGAQRLRVQCVHRDTTMCTTWIFISGHKTHLGWLGLCTDRLQIVELSWKTQHENTHITVKTLSHTRAPAEKSDLLLYLVAKKILKWKKITFFSFTICSNSSFVFQEFFYSFSWFKQLHTFIATIVN